MKLPRFHTGRPDPHHRHQLARWVQEWHLFNALCEDTSTAVAPAATPVPDDRSTDSPIAPGDIRLLHPSIEPMMARYVTVLEQHHGSQVWLVIPFGMLSQPATPEEVRTERRGPLLGVLCAWNRLTIANHILQRCWRVGRLTDKEMVWLRSAPPANRVGPPLRHPLDPRWDYLEMESEFRQRVCTAAAPPVTYDIPYPPELRRAAEDSAPYGSEEDQTEDDNRNNDA